MSEPQQSTVDLRAGNAAGATAVGPATGASANSDEAVARAEQSSVGELVKEVANDLSTLVRQEIALAKAEVKEDAKEAGKAAGLLGGAGFAGWMTALFASWTLFWALAEILDGWLWLSALIVTALWGIAGAVLFLTGKKTLQKVDPAPRETIQTVKEDVQWARTRNG